MKNKQSVEKLERWMKQTFGRDYGGDFSKGRGKWIKEKISTRIDQAQQEARIDELKRLYLVYGSKDKPASLDNLFSLGKKGERSATPIKDRLSELEGGK